MLKEEVEKNHFVQILNELTGGLAVLLRRTFQRFAVSGLIGAAHNHAASRQTWQEVICWPAVT